ncbi:MAG: hypothetical protein JW719_07175 [Pirellulales bacterium]|nr:hypothetical protein [Pirellulales bacterium]
MNSNLFDASTRFFKSFVAGELPLRPVDEVDAEHIGGLVSFYAADYDETGKLTRLRKFLNADDTRSRAMELVFTENYEYAENGELRCRTLIRSDGKESRWFFGVGSRKSYSCHDRLSAIEADIIRDIQQSDLRGRALAHAMTRKMREMSESVFKNLAEDPGLGLCLLTLAEDIGWEPLDMPHDLGFFPANLVEVVEPLVLNRNTPLLLPSVNDLTLLPTDCETVFRMSGISSIGAMPIRMCMDDQVVPVAILLALVHRPLDSDRQQCMDAMLRRTASFFEILLEMGRRESLGESIPPKSNEDTGTARN